jgi:hypothetical protein
MSRVAGRAGEGAPIISRTPGKRRARESPPQADRQWLTARRAQTPPHPASVLETQRNNKRGQDREETPNTESPSRPVPTQAPRRTKQDRQPEPDCEGNRVPKNQILCVRTRGSERRGAVRAHWP